MVEPPEYEKKKYLQAQKTFHLAIPRESISFDLISVTF